MIARSFLLWCQPRSFKNLTGSNTRTHKTHTLVAIETLVLDSNQDGESIRHTFCLRDRAQVFKTHASITAKTQQLDIFITPDLQTAFQSKKKGHAWNGHSFVSLRDLLVESVNKHSRHAFDIVQKRLKSSFNYCHYWQLVIKRLKNTGTKNSPLKIQTEQSLMTLQRSYIVSNFALKRKKTHNKKQLNTWWKNTLFTWNIYLHGNLFSVPQNTPKYLRVSLRYLYFHSMTTLNWQRALMCRQSRKLIPHWFASP